MRFLRRTSKFLATANQMALPFDVLHACLIALVGAQAPTNLANAEGFKKTTTLYDDVSVFTKPDFEAEIIEYLPLGTIIDVIDQKEGQVFLPLVRNHRVYGYVSELVVAPYPLAQTQAIVIDSQAPVYRIVGNMRVALGPVGHPIQRITRPYLGRSVILRHLKVRDTVSVYLGSRVLSRTYHIAPLVSEGIAFGYVDLDDISPSSAPEAPPRASGVDLSGPRQALLRGDAATMAKLAQDIVEQHGAPNATRLYAAYLRQQSPKLAKAFLNQHQIKDLPPLAPSRAISEEIQPGASGWVVATAATLRTKPSTGAKATAKLPIGATVKVISLDSNFYEVRYDVTDALMPPRTRRRAVHQKLGQQQHKHSLKAMGAWPYDDKPYDPESTEYPRPQPSFKVGYLAKALLATDPFDERDFMRSAELHLKNGNTDDAITNLVRALYVAPDSISVAKHLVAKAFDAERFDVALWASAHAQTLENHSTHFSFSHQLLNRCRGNPEHAELVTYRIPIEGKKTLSFKPGDFISATSNKALTSLPKDLCLIGLGSQLGAPCVGCDETLSPTAPGSSDHPLQRRINTAIEGFDKLFSHGPILQISLTNQGKIPQSPAFFLYGYTFKQVYACGAASDLMPVHDKDSLYLMRLAHGHAAPGATVTHWIDVPGDMGWTYGVVHPTSPDESEYLHEGMLTKALEQRQAFLVDPDEAWDDEDSASSKTSRWQMVFAPRNCACNDCF